MTFDYGATVKKLMEFSVFPPKYWADSNSGDWMSWNQTPCTTLCDIGEVPCVLMEHKICDVGGEVHAFGPLEWKLNCDSFASIFLIWYVNEQVRDQCPSSMDNLPRLNSGASEWGVSLSLLSVQPTRQI